MQARQPSRLVAVILSAITFAASARMGVKPGTVPIGEMKLDSFWKARHGYAMPRKGLNGSARVKRAAQKARNVARNRRAHRHAR